MSVNQFIQFITREILLFMELPAEERRRRKELRREQRSSWSHHWFGAVPLAIGMLVSSIRSKVPKWSR